MSGFHFHSQGSAVLESVGGTGAVSRSSKRAGNTLFVPQRGWNLVSPFMSIANFNKMQQGHSWGQVINDYNKRRF